MIAFADRVIGLARDDRLRRLHVAQVEQSADGARYESQGRRAALCFALALAFIFPRLRR